MRFCFVGLSLFAARRAKIPYGGNFDSEAAAAVVAGEWALFDCSLH